MGTIRAICISEKKGTQKQNIGEGLLVENHGLKDDAHVGGWHRQVSLLSYDKVEEFNSRGGQVQDGDFGENILVEGMDLRALPVGTVLTCNGAELAVTQIGKECHQHCQIYHRVGDCIMPREGIFARVLKGGSIKVGDQIKIAGFTPILSVVGNSGSGKTTYLEKLIPALKSRGLRLGVIKHDAHRFEIDIPGKDSWRLTQAGADVTLVSSSEKFAMVEKWQSQESLEEMAARVKNVDLILTEGFKQSNVPKIEIRRAAAGHSPLFYPPALFAVAGDYAPDKETEKTVPWLSLEDAEPMADYIMEYITATKKAIFNF